jgi:hypothetical protein
MKHAVTRELFGYWDRLREGRAAPERAQVDPAQIRAALADTFMLEVDRERTYPLRLAGARTSALFLRELKGLTFMHLWRDSDRFAVQQVLAGVMDEPAAAVAGVSASVFGRAPLALELLLLPLRHDGRTHSRILGCLAPTALPSWFGLVPADALSLDTLRILDAAVPRRPFGLPARSAANPLAQRFGPFTLYERPPAETAGPVIAP